MSAQTSYILVIIRVCVGERKMAGVSQNSSGGGRVMGAMQEPTLLSWSLHFGIQGSGGLSTEVACGGR